MLLTKRVSLMIKCVLNPKLGSALRLKHLILLSLMFFVVTTKAQTSQTLSLNSNGQASLNLANLNLSDCFSNSYFLPSRAIGDDHAMWLSNNSFPASSTDFLFDSNAKFIQNVDGTATLTGILTNTANSQDQWEVTLYLSNGSNWSQWSSLGRSYKDEGGYANGNHVNWTYYIINPNTPSQLVGLQGNAGKTVPILHMPANLNIGFQFGTGANMKNAGFGMSGWFSYSLNGTNYHQGDFNLDLSSIERVIQRTASKTAFACADLGTNTITVTSTDQFGNSCTQAATVTVQDITPPNVVTKNITRVIGASGTVTITANDVLDFNCSSGGISEPQPVPGAGDEADFFARPCTSDNCTITFYDIDKKTFTCNEAGQNIVTATVRDQSGNTTTATAIVTIINNAVPTLSTKNITVELDADGNAAITPQMVLNQYGINCGNVTLSLNKTTFDCSNIGQNTVTLIATASNGQIVSKTAKVTVVDNLAPVVVTKNISINLDQWGGAYLDPKDLLVICDDAVIIDQGGGGGGDFVPGTGYSEQLVAPVYEATCTKDNCAIASIVASIAYFDCSNVGQNTVSITVTDVSGNSTTATAIVTVNDITPPTVVTKNINVSLDASGNASITPAQVDNGSADICGVTLSLDKDSFNCSETGPQTVTLTATDPSGNTTSKTATVIVADVTAPTVKAKNITLALDANGNASITAASVDNGSFDNCDISLSVDKVNFDCSMIGAHNVTLTGVDPSGNTASAIAIVTVVDNLAPVITTQNITVSLNSNGTSVITTAQLASATDNCGTPTVSISKNEFNCNDLGIKTVTITATDANGNVSTSTATVTVEDITPPNVVTKNITRVIGASGSVTITANDVLDFNCSTGGISEPQPVPGAGDEEDFFARPCTSDNCTITFYDIDKKTFTCNEAGQNIVTATVRDQSGNTTTATAIVTIINNSVPTLSTKNITVELDADGNASITPQMVLNQYGIDCGNITLSLNKTTFDCSNIGENTVTLIATASNGQVVSKTATVTVVDNLAPVVVTKNISINLDQWGGAYLDPKDLLVICDDAVIIDQGGGGGGDFVPGTGYSEQLVAPVYEATCTKDNCAIASIVASIAYFDCSNVGQNTVSITVTDVSGNSTTATAIVTVNDITPPTVVTKNINVSLDASGNASITPAQVDNGSADICGVTLSLDKDSFNCSETGPQTVTLTATDPSGNTTSKTATVIVADVTAPTVKAKNITLALDANGNASITAASVDNGSFDNCDISLSVDKVNFDCSMIGVHNVTLTGVDPSGNTASAIAIVTVVDNLAPVITTQNITVSLNSNGTSVITTAQLASATDNCGTPTISISKNEFNCNDLGIKTVTITATDANGNVATATATVTVEDNIAPTVIAQNISVTLDANGNANITAALVDNGSFDNCELTLSIDKTSFDCSTVGDQVVTLTGVDPSGNTASATATVTVINNNAPEVITNDVTLNLDSNGNASVSVADLVQDAVEICETTAFQGGNNHAIWLSKYTPSNQNVLFQFDANGGELIQYPDGTATMTGTIVNPGNANDKWIVQLNLDQKRNWTEWSSLGRSWKGNANTVGNNYKDWAYYQMSTSTPTTLTGAGSNVGQVKTLTHMPANYNYGFQIGQAANDKNSNYGMSGWFFYTNGQGQSVQGDFNMDITSCTVSTGSGPCDPASIEISQTDFDCSDLGENTVTLTITANNGQVTTKTTSITIEDNIAPTVVTKNITLALDANGNANITASQVDNGSFDNCDLTLSIDKTSFDCSDLGAQTVTLTGIDPSGNTASATAVVTVIDNAAPVLATQNITVNLGTDGTYTISNAQVVSAADNCAVTELVVGQVVFDCSDIGENEVLVQAADAAGNITSATITVTVRDLIAPTVIAQNISVTLDANGNVNITAAQVDNGSFDNCDLTLSIDKTSFDCSTVGDHVVTLTGVDPSGNTASATAVVTVIGNVNEVNVQNITVPLGANGNTTVSAADVVTNAIEISNTTAYQGGNNHAVWLSKYTSSNQNVSFQFVGNGGELIQYPDGTATMTGVIVNPSNSNDTWTVQLNLDSKRNWSEWSALGRSWKGNPSNVGDNYKDWAYYQMSTSVPTTLVGSGINAGQTITLTHMPANYNYGFQVGKAANDKNKNVGMSGWFFYKNSQNKLVQGDFNLDISSTTVTTGTGPCDPASITISQTNFDCSNIGENTVTLTITANNGQVTTQTTTVTIEDNIAPTVVTKNITVALDANGNANITAAQVDNGSFDNCNLTLSIDKTSFDCSKVGAQTVTLTGTDASGNTASATATVTVVDNTAPTVITQSISVSLDANGNAIITAAQIDNGSSDNCGIASITLSKSTFNCSNIGVNTVTLTVTDNNGNISSKTATVTIVDNIAPTVIAKNITVALNANGNVNITAAQVDNGSSDNCNLTLSVDKVAFDCSDLGTQTVILTGTDASGNTASTAATVTVVDNTTPVFTSVVNNKVFQAENGNCDFAAYWNIPAATDNCLVSVTSTHNPGDIFPIGTTTVTYTATDAAGNVATTQFDVTVLASPLNVVTQASSYTTNSGMYNVSCSDANDGEIMLSVTGGCAPYTFAWSNGSTDQNLSNVEAGIYTVTITDKNGLQVQKTISLTAPDPIVIDKSVTSEYTLSGYGEENTVYLGFGEQTVVLQANATGGSGEYTYEWTPSEEVACSFENTITVAPQVTTTYTVVVTDSNGCSTTENFTIEVVDVRCTETTPPGEDNGGDDDFDCQCEGKMKSFTVVYQGFFGVTIKALKKNKSSVITTYKNVQNGDIITVNGFDFKGRFDSKTFLQIGSVKYEIHTSCSINILGQTYGPFKVIAYTDGEGASCSLNSSNNHMNGQAAPNGTPSHAGGSTFGQDSNKDHDDDDKGSKDDDDDDKGSKDDDDDDDKGGKDDDDDKGSKDDDDDDKGSKDDDDDDKGSKDDDDDDKGSKDDDDDDKGGKDDDDDDVTTDCQCEGRMESFRVIYNGPSGKTVTAYNKKKDKIIAVYHNVQFGDEIFVSRASNTSGNPSTAGGSTYGKDDKDDDHDDDDDKGGKDDKDDDHDDDDDKGGKDDKDDDHDDDDDKGGKDDKDDDHDDDDDKGGKDDDRLDSKTFLRVHWIDYEIHTSCSINILGMEVGPFKVIEYTDGEGFTCSLDDDDNGGGGNNGGCDVETVEWEGNITICYNNQMLCVNQSEVKTYLDLGASLGACPTASSSPAGAVGGFNLSSDVVSEQVVQVEISTYPNPATDFAQISFNVNKEGPVSVAVFDTRGMQVGHTLFEENAEVDKTYTVVFDASSVKEGMYIIRLNTQGYIESKKLLIKR